MNLDEAITKHAEWKVKFRSAMAKKERLDASAIGMDTRCDLGKWLAGEGRRLYGAKTNFAQLVALHAEFHKAAGKVAALINAEKYEQAETMLGGSAEYALASSNVVTAITRLKKEI